MKLYVILFTFLVSSNTLNENTQRKIISDGEYKYVFYVSPKTKLECRENREYYWYKSGEIHSSVGGYFGELLHGDYTKSYLDNNISEQGEYKNGLKNDRWKKWHKNGKLKELLDWDDGLKSGSYFEYSENGKILLKGKYKNDWKHGTWVNLKTKDTLRFNKGKAVDKDLKVKKTFKEKIKSFFKGIFSKKEKDSSSKKKEKNTK